MGSSHGKQSGEKGYFRRRSSIRKILRIRSNNPPRPVSYAGIDDQPAREHPISLRPLSMYDALPFHHFDISKPIESHLRIKNPSSRLFFFQANSSDDDRSKLSKDYFYFYLSSSFDSSHTIACT